MPCWLKQNNFLSGITTEQAGTDRMSIGLSLELESEVDAQAFAKGGPNALRAVKATIEDGQFVLSGSLRHNYEQTAG